MKKQHKIALFTITAVSSIAIASSLTPEPALTTVHAPEKFDKTADISHFKLDNAKATDTARNLTWQRCLVGQTFEESSKSCKGEATAFKSWQEALAAVPAGWRMPNAKELASIVEETQIYPALNVSVFPFANTLKNYSHKGTTEEIDRNKPPTHKDYPNVACVKVETKDYYGFSVTKYFLPKGYLDSFSEQDWARECKVPAKIPASYTVQLNAPYIWSSTPVATTASQQTSAKFSYALDTSDGSLKTNSNRDGSAVGGYQDSHNEQKASYVLLVKDAS